MPHALGNSDGPDHGALRLELIYRLAADAQRRWGPERAAALADAIAMAAATLAQVAAIELEFDDDEPDFIR